MDFKRDKIKYIRDRAKARYQKGTACRICDTDQQLEFHHYHSLTPLFNKWLKDNKIKLQTEQDLLDVRDKFIEEHHSELYDEAVTLCKPHHMKLHSIYGKDPPLATAEKQKRWVGIQRGKTLGQK